MFGRREKKQKRRFYKRKRFWILILLFLLLGGGGGWYGWHRLQPYMQKAESYDLALIDKVKEPSLILDRKGREIGRMFSENRDKIPIQEVPQLFIDALLAQEDQRFFEHDGVDWIGVSRAVYLNVKSRGVTQGAGTITMQLVRNAFDLPGEARREKQTSYERKMIEAFLALRLEREMVKQFSEANPDPFKAKKAMKTQLLEYYINRVPFGSGNYGIRAASLGYFGKEPSELELQECASIVACVKNPSLLNPLRRPKKNKEGRDHVIRRMALEQMISDEERDRLIALPVTTKPNPILRGKSHLYEKIKKLTLAKVGEEAMAQGGFSIHTTIDLDLQTLAESALRHQLDAIEVMPGYKHARYDEFVKGQGAPKYLQGAILLVDHQSGHALAHVGGRDYAQSQYDFLELGRRPLGTAFFPFVTATALETGKTLASRLLDEQMNNRQLMVGGLEGVVGEWGMEILNPEYLGKITARTALLESKIAASVRLGMEVGLPRVMAGAQSFGFDFPEEKVLNRNLVGWNPASVPEVVNAFCAFGNGGQRLEEFRYIDRIEDAYGEVVFESGSGSPATQTACSEATAFQVHTVLNEVLSDGNLSDVSSFPFPGGGKSGTPYNFTDAWMAGYTGRLSGAVWIGFHQGSRKAIVPRGFAKRLAYPIWREVMDSAVSDYPADEILRPDSVKEVLACRHSGMKPTRYCNESFEDPVTGSISFRSTSYPEYFPADMRVGMCDIHGAGVDIGPLTDARPPRKALPVVPIRSTAPLLLGFDPYLSEKPSLAPEDASASEGFYLNQDSLVIEDHVPGEREARLRLPRPPRFELPDDDE